MKRHTLIRLTVLFLIFISKTSLYANENFSDSIRLGHPDESYDIYDKLNNPDKDLNLKRAAAIYIPASKMKLYKGNSITAIKFALAPNIFFTELNIFVAKDLNQPYTYKQQVSSKQKTGWNSIQLDTPYKIDTDEGIYIGYEYKASNNLVGKLSSTEDTSMDWVYKDGSWIPSSDIHDHALAIQGVVKGNQLPQYNITLQYTKIPVFAKLGESATISGTFTNEATATLHNFKVNYRIDGGEWISEKIDNVTIPYEASYNFKTNHLTFLKEGEYIVEVSISDLNGEVDIDQTDNISQPYTIGCVASLTERNVLMEIYSTELCNNCPKGHEHIKNIVNGNNRVIMLGHHAGYGYDSYTHPASTEYAGFYDVRNAPSLMIDRTQPNQYNPQLSATGPLLSAGSLTTKLLNDFLDLPAFVSLNLTTEYNEESREATIHIDGKRLLPLSSTNNRLFIYLTEDNIHTTTQSGSDGSFYHQHTLRQVLTDTWGEAIDTNNFSKDYRITIDGTWSCDDMHVIASVGNYDSDNITNCIIYNSAQVKLTKRESDINNKSLDQISVRTTDKTIYISGEYDGFCLYNLAGKCLMQRSESQPEISIKHLPESIYLLYLQEKEGCKIFKIISSK